MPLESILFLGLVIGALIVFASALVYGDWATRQAMREMAAPQPSSMTLRKTPAVDADMGMPAKKAA